MFPQFAGRVKGLTALGALVLICHFFPPGTIRKITAATCLAPESVVRGNDSAIRRTLYKARGGPVTRAEEVCRLEVKVCNFVILFPAAQTAGSAAARDEPSNEWQVFREETGGNCGHERADFAAVHEGAWLGGWRGLISGTGICGRAERLAHVGS